MKQSCRTRNSNAVGICSVDGTGEENREKEMNTKRNENSCSFLDALKKTEKEKGKEKLREEKKKTGKEEEKACISPLNVEGSSSLPLFLFSLFLSREKKRLSVSFSMSNATLSLSSRVYNRQTAATGHEEQSANCGQHYHGSIPRSRVLLVNLSASAQTVEKHAQIFFFANCTEQDLTKPTGDPTGLNETQCTSH